MPRQEHAADQSRPSLLHFIPVGTAQRLLRSRLGQSGLVRGIGRLLFGSNNSIIRGGNITWNGLSFYFAADYRTFVKASNTGIENRICRLVQAHLKAGDSAIDVGANFGFVTLVMARSVGAGGRVLSFEIDPQIVATLQNTVHQNSVDEVVTLVAQGAGAPDQSQFTTVDEQIERLRLDRVRLIKIDVDGGDYFVLLGAERTITNYHPLVIIEMQAMHQEIYEFFVAHGYRYFAGNDGKSFQIGEWPPNLMASMEPIEIPSAVR